MDDRTDKIAAWWADLPGPLRDRAHASVEVGTLDADLIQSLADAGVFVASDAQWVEKPEPWTFPVPDDVAEYVRRH